MWCRETSCCIFRTNEPFRWNERTTYFSLWSFILFSLLFYLPSSVFFSFFDILFFLVASTLTPMHLIAPSLLLLLTLYSAIPPCHRGRTGRSVCVTTLPYCSKGCLHFLYMLKFVCLECLAFCFMKQTEMCVVKMTTKTVLWIRKKKKNTDMLTHAVGSCVTLSWLSCVTLSWLSCVTLSWLSPVATVFICCFRIFEYMRVREPESSLCFTLLISVLLY